MSVIQPNYSPSYQVHRIVTTASSDSSQSVDQNNGRECHFGEAGSYYDFQFSICMHTNVISLASKVFALYVAGSSLCQACILRQATRKAKKLCQ